jgi:hypothetical protein
MKYSYLIMLLFLLAGLSTACTSAKERNLNEFRVMMKEVEKEHDSFTEADWKERNPKMEELLKEFEELEPEMTREEREEVVRGAYRYYLYQYKEGALARIKMAREDQFAYLLEHAEIMLESSAEVLEEMGPEIEALAEEFARFSEDLIEKMEERGIFDKLENAAKKLEEAAERIEEKARERE